MALPETIRDLLENGVHFGHLSKHWNPKMKKFIFGKKKNIYIIDLEKTAGKLEEAKDFVREMASKGNKILFVVTKKQLKETIEAQAIRCDMPYVVDRWIGGFLTNFPTIQARMKNYMELTEKREKGEFEKYTTKEVLRINRELEKMEKNYRGVVTLNDLPSCVYIVDPKRETAAVREAKKLGIPIIALVDTDSDPEIIDYPIPGNDDAIKSVNFITSCIVEAVMEGLKEYKAGASNQIKDTKETEEKNIEKDQHPEERKDEEEKQKQRSV